MADIVFPGDTAKNVLNEGALPSNNDLVIYKGDYLELLVTITDSTGTPVNTAAYTGKAQLKSDYSDRAPKDFTVTASGTPGQYRIFLSSTITRELLPGTFIWDFQLTSGSGETRTYLAGDVTVYNEVTT